MASEYDPGDWLSELNNRVALGTYPKGVEGKGMENRVIELLEEILTKLQELTDEVAEQREILTELNVGRIGFSLDD